MANEEIRPLEGVTDDMEIPFKKEVTIKFGKGLMGEPFQGKNGKEYVEIKIPNQDPKDSQPWESFILPRSFVHENKFGKGMWVKLPEDRTTKVTRSIRTGTDENGRTIWQHNTREVSNTELKAMVEAYKERGKNSVLSNMRTHENKHTSKGKKRTTEPEK